MLSTVHSVCGETLIPGLLKMSCYLYLLMQAPFQELQSMNIAARLYTVSTGRVRDS
jgi:hypothetical protein